VPNCKVGLSTARLAAQGYVCECHFLQEDFTNAERIRLNINAVPVQTVLPLEQSEQAREIEVDVPRNEENVQAGEHGLLIEWKSSHRQEKCSKRAVSFTLLLLYFAGPSGVDAGYKGNASNAESREPEMPASDKSGKNMLQNINLIC
jgi:hypothetical protein